MNEGKSIIRWSRVGPALIFLVVLFVLIFFFLDPFVKLVIQKGGQAVFGAKVDVASASLSLRKSSLKIHGLQVADKSSPMQNLFQFDDAVMDARALPLLDKKVIIEQASITGLKFGTPRKTSGALTFEDKRPGFVGKAMDRVTSQIESIGLEKFDSAKKYYDPKTVVNADNLETYKAADKARQSFQSAPAELQKEIAGLKADERAAALQKRVSALGQGSNDPTALLQKAGEVKAIQQDLASLKADISNTQKSVTDRIQAAQSQLEEVKKAKEEDWKKIRSTLSLPTLDKASIARAIFGPKVAQHLERGLGYVHTAREYMPAKPQAPPPPPRGKGRTIEFPRTNELPRFLLVKATLSGEVGQETPFGFSGSLEGITTNPPLYGKPAVLQLQGSQGARAFRAKALIDHTQPVPSEQFEGSYKGFPIGAMAFGDEKGSIGLNLAQGTGEAQASLNVSGDALKGDLRFQGTNLAVQPKLDMKTDSDIAKRISGSLTTSLSQVKTLGVGVGVSGTLSSPDLSINSNLGDIVANSLKGAVGAEVEQQEKALRAELDKLTNAKIQELQSSLDGLKSQYLPKLAGNTKVVDDLLNQVKNQGSGKAVDSLKGLFGR